MGVAIAGDGGQRATIVQRVVQRHAESRQLRVDERRGVEIDLAMRQRTAWQRSITKTGDWLAENGVLLGVRVVAEQADL